MSQHLVYKCPKCQNTLLVSNKMLHDLRCTEDNPATYENILRQSQRMEPSSPYSQSNSNYSRFSSSMRRSNNDGTSSEIKKNINYNGEEEFIETTYDPEGNIISRKKTQNIEYNTPQVDNYQNVSEFYEYEDENDYEEDNVQNEYHPQLQPQPQIQPQITVPMNKPEQIVYHTAAPQEIIYEAPAKYDPTVTINQPIQQTIINGDVNLNDSIMNDLIRSTMKQAGNKNISIQISNGNIGNNLDNYKNDITTYNYNQTNIINNISKDAFNPGFKINDLNNVYNKDLKPNQFNYNYYNNYNTKGMPNNMPGFNMTNDDVLRKTAGIGSQNYSNNYNYNNNNYGY